MTQDPIKAEEALGALTEVMRSGESETARISAAKAVLDRLAPKEDDEAQRHEAEERDAALTEASQLLAEFAALKLALLRQSRALAKAGEAGTDNAAG